MVTKNDGKEIICQPSGMFANFGYTGGQSLSRKNNFFHIFVKTNFVNTFAVDLCF